MTSLATRVSLQPHLGQSRLAQFDQPCVHHPDQWSPEDIEELQQAVDMLEDLGTTSLRNAKTLRDAQQWVMDVTGKPEAVASAPVAERVATASKHELN